MTTLGMKNSWRGLALVLCFVGAMTISGAAQTTVGQVPIFIPVSGQVAGLTGPVEIVLSLHDGPDDPPRWLEPHSQVVLDAQGRYSLTFGTGVSGTSTEGLPPEIFAGTPSPRWVGVSINGVDQPKVMLVGVPYAAKAVEADTLAGRTVSDFMLSSTFREDLRTVLQEEGVTAPAGVSAEAITNSLQKSNGAGGLLDTNIYHVDGRIGIGTAGPVDPFQIRQGTDLNFFVSQNSGMVAMGAHNDAWSAWGDLMINGSLVFKSSGNVGIGTTSPVDKLQVRAGQNLNFGVFTNSGMMALGAHNDAWSAWGDLMLNGNAVFKANGNIGLGTLNPTSKLHVSGDVTVDGNIGAKYQDVAEWVDAVEPLDAGSVVIIAEDRTNHVTASNRSYDGRVAGAISPQPGIVLGESGPGRVLVAQSGRVRVKADAKYGAIRPGDLLVTSPTKGHAMRSKPVRSGGQQVHRPGTVLGKALEALPSGQGEILVLITLQ